MELVDIKSLIRQKGLRMGWVAGEIRISQNSLTAIAQRKVVPNLRTAQRLGRILDLSTDQLFPLPESGQEHQAGQRLG